MSNTGEPQLPLRIVGCGSAHGDDAVGWDVVRGLQEAAKDLPHVELHKVQSGHQILDLLDGRGTLIVVDAVSSGQSPGTIHHLHWPDARATMLHPGSTHALRLAYALQLAAALGILPPQVVVFGVEMAPSGAHRTGLSAPVALALPQLTQRIIDAWLTGPAPGPPNHGFRRRGAAVTEHSRFAGRWGRGSGSSCRDPACCRPR